MKINLWDALIYLSHNDNLMRPRVTTTNPDKRGTLEELIIDLGQHSRYYRQEFWLSSSPNGWELTIGSCEEYDSYIRIVIPSDPRVRPRVDTIYQRDGFWKELKRLIQSYLRR